MKKLFFLVFLLASCDFSVESLEGKWIDDNGNVYFTHSAGDNKLILTATDDAYLLFGEQVLTQQDDPNVFSGVKKDNYHEWIYEIEVKDTDHLKLTRRVLFLDTGLSDGSDIVYELTRMNNK